MKILRINEIPIGKNTNLYNLEVEENNNYYANGILVSNCHMVDAKEIKGVLLACTSAKRRYGFTGTLPKTRAEYYGILNFIGPHVLNIKTKKLIEQGYVSDLRIVSIHLTYDTEEEYKGLPFPAIKKKIIREPKRLAAIRKICESTDKNALILVSYIEEGDVLEEYIREELPGKNVHFIHGNIKVGEREKIRKAAEWKKNMLIIATYGVFKLGLNVKNIHRIILASPLKKDIPNLQSIGRGLRVLPGKMLIVFDLVDHVRILLTHGRARAKIWRNENFEVKEIEI